MKPRYDLIPPDGLRVVAQRLADGCAKHGERGGQLGDVNRDTLLEKMLRHADQAVYPRRDDPESIEDHLAAVAFNAMRAIEVLDIGAHGFGLNQDQQKAIADLWAWQEQSLRSKIVLGGAAPDVLSKEWQNEREHSEP